MTISIASLLLAVVIVITLILAFVLGIVGLSTFGSYETCAKHNAFNLNYKDQFTLARLVYGICGLSVTVIIMCCICFFMWLISIC